MGQWLAEYGAEVIHIERPVIGDYSRAYPPLVNGISIKYCTLNHGKKSVILDLKDPDGNKIARELCKDADIVLESTRPGVMDRLGLGYEAMHELNPRLIYCSVSAWGQTGPYAHRPGYDLIAQGASLSLIHIYAVDRAIENLEVEGKGHSSCIWSHDQEHIEYTAKRIPVGRFHINQPTACLLYTSCNIKNQKPGFGFHT